jgi:hypothetical protein
MSVTRLDFARWRKEYVHVLPAVLLGIGIFQMTGDTILARLITAAIGGFVLHGALLIGYFASAYFVGWLAGEPVETRTIPPKGFATTGALLLVTIILVLGQHRQQRTERRIERCLRESEMQRRAGLLGHPFGTDAVDYCVYGYGTDGADPYDE